MFRSLDYITAYSDGWVAFGAPAQQTSARRGAQPLQERLALFVQPNGTWAAGDYSLAFTWGPERETVRAQLKQAATPLWAITFVWDPLAQCVRRMMVAANGAYGCGMEQVIDQHTTETTLDLTLPDGERIQFKETRVQQSASAFTTETTPARGIDGAAAETLEWVRAG